jgi:carbonic anhydrase
VTTNDVYALPKLYKFEAEYIDFHSPSEHRINGSKFDVEMQIYHKDIFKKSKSKEAMVVSIMFNVTDDKPDNDFFTFLDGKSKMDVSEVLPIDFMMHNTVFGYLGTRTSEGCATGVGWYISPVMRTISEADYEIIRKEIVIEGNNREFFSIRTKRLFSHPPFFGSAS